MITFGKSVDICGPTLESDLVEHDENIGVALLVKKVFPIRVRPLTARRFVSEPTLTFLVALLNRMA
jgi:hypothetical protein